MDLTKKRKMEDNGVIVVPAEAEALMKFTPDDARRIIEPFSHENLLEIVQNAAVRHLDVLDAIRSIADRDTTQRKLFIRGLGWDTTTDKLRNLFSAYGELEEAIVINDKTTGKSKGYGFVTFKHVDGALLALKEPSKKIDGRMTVTQLAVLGNSGSNANAAAVDVSARKIYVANVPSDIPADRLLAHFSSYGEIEEGPLGFDKLTGKSKGFALFVYKTAEAARASLVDPMKTIDGHQLMCKLAIEGKKGRPQGGPGGDQHIGDGIGMPPPSSMPGSQFGPTGMPYGGYSGGLQGPGQMGHHPHGMNSSLPSSLGGAQAGGQGPSSYGSGGIGGPFGSAPYGAGSGGYAGLGGGVGGMGGSSGGMGGTGGGTGNAGGGGGLGNAGSGLGGGGMGSSLYNRVPANSSAMPSSGAYPEMGPYNLGLLGYAGQHQQPSGTSPAPRVPQGGMHQGIPPYY